METKVCAKCKVEKPTSEYHKNNRKKIGVQYSCKECISEYRKIRYWSNREIELGKMTASRIKPKNVLQRKGYYAKNKEEYRERYLTYMADDSKREAKKIRGAAYEKANREKIAKRKKAHRDKPEVKERHKQRHIERKATDIQYVIKRRLRFRLRHVVKAIGDDRVKYKSAIILLGCDIEQFKVHIESLFTEGMSWSFVLSGEIHMDHKKPCKLFDLSKSEEQKECFHYSNIQPLWAVDNLIKNAKYDD